MKFKDRRRVDTVIISDVHLGTYGCHAIELARYLKSIAPRRLVLNGDIIDGWQFSKSYFPNSHMKVVKELLKLLSKDVEIWYIPGNHDEMMRRFVGQNIGGLHIDNKVVLDLDGRKAWVFHGDVFDVSMRHSKFIAKLGGHGYDLLIVFNQLINKLLNALGRDKISLSKKIKDSVKAAVRFVDDFEETAINLGRHNGYDFVICGHIHRPTIRPLDGITYLNSGDWVENLTALEFDRGQWSLYRYTDDPAIHNDEMEPDAHDSLTAQQIYMELTREFKVVRTA